ncbi:MAG TPA: SDR family NAD(P)-dependent oxidoreductase [Candidatus Udaeobacter sp.]|nr:SDR family NAD(P)-dependent oxidoreductase [Candidatus Udaeobacter sp.]
MKRVFLTGASSGIGRAIAHALLARGDEVLGTSRNLERIPKMPRWHPVRLDLADPHSAEAAFNAALTDARYFDVLINNAGAGHFDPTELVPMETIASQFQILVFGQIQLMQLALHHMQARREGLIINVTSLASRLPVPFMAAYNALRPSGQFQPPLSGCFPGERERDGRNTTPYSKSLPKFTDIFGTTNEKRIGLRP